MVGTRMTNGTRSWAWAGGAAGLAATGLWAIVCIFSVGSAPAAERNDSESKTKFGSTASGSAVTDQEIVEFINREIRKGWADAGLSPSNKATDGEWCRRAFLDIIGRVPTPAELSRYMADPANTRKQKLLDRLLDSDEYTVQYATYWGNVYTNLLIGRPQPREERTLINREGMHAYLRGAFGRNKPYDQIAFELISATGATSKESKGFNGATNFLVNMLAENATQATSKTSKMFLGVQVQCTQCHNHPFNDWKQDQFWSMNAFFRQTKARATDRAGRAVESALLENVDFRGEGSTPHEAEIYYELRNGTMAVAYPTFVDGTKINPDGSVDKVDRRAELGKLIVKSEFFGKAIANRLWAHFLGYGFTKPVDDMGPHNPASHPELLERLGQEFSSHGHDFKKLVRWITLSEPYGLSSLVSAKNKKDDPTLGEKPKFSRFYLRQMQPEQLYDSMNTLMLGPNEVVKRDGNVETYESTRRMWMSQFTVNLGNDEGDELTTFNGTIPQALMMMNGDLTKKIISADEKDKESVAILPKLASAGYKPNDAIEYLYLAVFARKPTTLDVKLCLEMMGSRGGSATAYQDILWALVNSNEFIFNH